jgi:hypothetical protein
MEIGRDRLLAARAALLAGDVEVAKEKFEQAEDAFVQARGHADNPLLRMVSLLPIIGRTPDAATGLSEAGHEVSLAGVSIAGGVAALPNGLASLAPHRGRIDTASYAALAPALAEATSHLQRAGAAVGDVKTTWLLGPVAEARRQFANELQPITRGLEAATAVVRRFPAFLGSEGVRRYLFVAENPAELRGTGGLFGSVAVMTLRDGKISFGPFEPNERFPLLPRGRVPPPNEDFGRLYPDSAGLMVVTNLTADFPSAAIALQRLYEASRPGVKLDGVISADPFALQAMLEVSGPVTVGPLGTVTPENVIALVSNRAYSIVTDGEARGRVLGEVAGLVIGRFLAGAQAQTAATAIAGAAGGGHLTIHVDDEEMQRALARANADGGLPGSGGDLVGPIVNNGGANKVDYYAKRFVKLAVELGAENVARWGLDMSIHNGAPTTGQPVYVIGPNGYAQTGENLSLLSLYAPPGAELLEYRQNGEPVGLGVETELGHALFSSDVAIPSGGRADLHYDVASPGAWEGTAAHGTYHLVYLGQTTPNPTTVRIQIDVPEGAHIIRTSVPMTVQGRRAVWEGTISTRSVFEVEFQKPFLARAWSALSRFFSKRLVSF